jgi:hypothetical protein
MSRWNSTSAIVTHWSSRRTRSMWTESWTFIISDHQWHMCECFRKWLSIGHNSLRQRSVSILRSESALLVQGHPSKNRIPARYSSVVPTDIRAAMLTMLWGRAIAQAVSRQLPTSAARVQTRVWSCGILWWTKVALGQVFSENFGFPCPIYIPSASPQSSWLSPEAGTIGQEWPQCQ